MAEDFDFYVSRPDPTRAFEFKYQRGHAGDHIIVENAGRLFVIALDTEKNIVITSIEGQSRFKPEVGKVPVLGDVVRLKF